MSVKNVLIVDDFRVAQLSLAKILKRRGISADLVSSGEEAIEYLDAKRPDLILMDYMMPGMDGLKAIETIVGNPETSYVPVVLCTANSRDELRVKAQEAGALGCLIKPINDKNLDELLDKLGGYPNVPREAQASDSVVPMALPALDLEAMVWQVASRAADDAKAAAGDVADAAIASKQESISANAEIVADRVARETTAKVLEGLKRTLEHDLGKNADIAVQKAVKASVKEAVDGAMVAQMAKLEHRASTMQRDLMLVCVAVLALSVLVNFLD